MDLKKKILIVEDDDFLREIYLDTFRNQGYDVDSAVDGEDAYTKIKNQQWNLIFLDIIMPKMTGLEVVKKLKDDPTITLKTPILFLTNLDNDVEMKEAIALGNGYLIKSQLTPGDLLKEAQTYLPR